MPFNQISHPAPHIADYNHLPLRDASILMRPERLGAMWQTRLSFARILMRTMCQHRWRVSPTQWDLDAEGRGLVVYRVETHNGILHVVFFATVLDPAEREDRVIASRWDAAGALIEGDVTPERIASMRENVPLQEYGRADPQTLVWTRANRSGRFFNAVVDSLAEGKQPDVDFLADGGYLMRSTAFYGNTKFGLAAYHALPDDHPVRGSFQAQMLTAFVLREFACDIAEHVAKARNPNAATLAPAIRRFLGVGNATGMGLVPFVINQPHVTNAWVTLREVALSRIRMLEIPPDNDDVARLIALLRNGIRYFEQDTCDDKGLFTSASTLGAELRQLMGLVETFRETGRFPATSTPAKTPWNILCQWSAAHCDIETDELLHATLIELYPDLTDELGPLLHVPLKDQSSPAMPLAQLKAILETRYRWALDWDLASEAANTYFWYFSVDSEEPLIGMRNVDKGEAFERPLDIPQRVQAVAADLAGWDLEQSVGKFLATHPQHRFMVERIQQTEGYPFAEIHTNLMGEDCIPLHLQRLQLAMYGMARFNPQSTRWVRVTMMQGAPIAADVAAGADPAWFFPLRPTVEQVSNDG